MRLYVLRHGDAAHTPYTYGVAKPLTEVGREQARSAGEALKTQGITHIYASTVQRTAETAAIVAEALGLPCEHSDEWVEQIIPAVDGLTLTEIRDRVPHLAPDRTDEPWWERDFGPEGETFPMLYERAQRAWNALRERHAGTADVPLLVTHGTFADFFVQAALELQPARHIFRFRNTGVAVLNAERPGPATLELIPLGGAAFRAWGTEVNA